MTPNVRRRGRLGNRPFGRGGAACASGVSRGEMGVRSWRLLSLILVFPASAWTGEPAAPGLLTTCASVRALSRDEAARNLPVRVQGVVTLLPFRSSNQIRFTVDDGEGIWVTPALPQGAAEVRRDLQVGDRVEVSGQTMDGRFTPIIASRSVRVLGRGPLPPPQTVTVSGLNSGKFDSQRVAISGVVQAVERVPDERQVELRLNVRSELGPFNFILIDARDRPVEGLVDAVVSLTGVCLSYFNSRGQFLGARVYSNEDGDLRVVRPGEPDAFRAPEVPLGRAMAFSPRGLEMHRQRVRGTVTLCRPGEYFFLQEAKHALRVNTRQGDRLEPGDRVEAAGFFELTHHNAELHETVFRRLGREAPPEAVEITREMAFAREPQSVRAEARDFDDRLVAVRGRLVSLDDKPGEPLRLNLVWEGALVTAEFHEPASRPHLAALRSGSELRVSGVCQLTFSASRPVLDWPQPAAMRLVARGPEDVIVVRAAPFWTPQRLTTATGALVLVLVGTLAWVVLLRRQVALRGQQLAGAIRERRDAVVEFESAARERNRLAADLHDTMEQSLTGLALQIEASQALHEATPERSRHHLALARQLLARSREELRRSIWNLRANPLEKESLVAALRQVAADRSAGMPVAISVRSEGADRPLPDFVAGNLLLLVQEGLTNALKHAEASRIEVTVNFRAGSLELRIRDNGKGFDPGSVAGPRAGHFGLQGMRERMKRLGGTLALESAPGAGTTLIATMQD